MKNSKEQRVYAFIYCVTLILVEMLAIWLPLSYFEGGAGILMLVIIVLLTAVLHFILCLVVGMVIHNAKNKRFSEEYSPIVAEYKETNDAQKMLDGLVNMKAAPKTDVARNAYNFSLSTAYFETGDMEQAKAFLLKVKSSDKNLIDEVKKQLALIEENLREKSEFKF